MEESFQVPPLAPGRYRHYKGNEYQVLGVGCHTETNEYFVVYQAVQQKPGLPAIWVRPYSMFVETVEVDGNVIPRFQKQDD
jgi:hypothetical protein